LQSSFIVPTVIVFLLAFGLWELELELYYQTSRDVILLFIHYNRTSYQLAF